MEDKKDKISFKSKLSFIIIIILIALPIILTYIDVDINKELIILFWVLLSLNFLFVIVVTISRLSNDFLVVKYYNYLFYRLYNERLDMNIDKGSINAIYQFFESQSDNIDFKREKIRLKEIVDSSYEVSAFPILTLSFTVLYAVSIYNNDTNTYIISLSNDIIFIILDLVLLFTFGYVFTLTYLKSKISLAKLCLNIIEEYELDR